MKNIYFFILVLWVLSSCAKDFSANSLDGSWKLLELRSSEEEDFVRDNGDVVITFVDGGLNFKTTRNTCMSKFEASDGGSFNAEGVWCTKVCCDSESEKLLIRILPEVTDFEIQGQRLFLRGEGEVRLRKD